MENIRNISTNEVMIIFKTICIRIRNFLADYLHTHDTVQFSTVEYKNILKAFRIDSQLIYSNNINKLNLIEYLIIIQ